MKKQKIQMISILNKLNKISSHVYRHIYCRNEWGRSAMIRQRYSDPMRFMKWNTKPLAMIDVNFEPPVDHSVPVQGLTTDLHACQLPLPANPSTDLKLQYQIIYRQRKKKYLKKVFVSQPTCFFQSLRIVMMANIKV